METADIVAHQYYWSDGTLGGVRSLDLVTTLPPIPSSTSGAAATDSGCYFDSSPSVFQLPEIEAAQDDEFGSGDGWMDWLAKEAGWSWGLNECCESSESSEMTGSALYCSSPAEDEIINLFFRCVKFVEEEESEKAAEALAELRRRCSPLGNPTERVVSYFALALSEAAPEKFEAAEVAAAHAALNDVSPYLNFAYLTANQAILDGAASAERIHIVDFGIRQGVQWAALLQALATRPQGKPRKIKITGLPSPSEPDSLSATGRRLTEFASFLGLKLEFSSSVLADVDDATLDYDYVAVNFMFHLSGLANVAAVTSALKLVGSMKPNVITLAEYELSWQRCSGDGGGGGGFQNAFEYFLAVFESVESKMGMDCGERARVERVLFGEEIKRAVDLGRNCGGCMRAMEEWRSIMEMGGFKRSGTSHYAMSQARILLENYSSKYSLMESAGAVSLGWQNRPLVTVSLWTP